MMHDPLPDPHAPGDPGEDALPSRGMADVIAKRVEQIIVHGHTAEADAAKPLHFFALDVGYLGNAIREDSTFGIDLATMRKHAVKLAAMTLALVDRIDAHPIDEPHRAPFRDEPGLPNRFAARGRKRR
jgi:hypothetical protein